MKNSICGGLIDHSHMLGQGLWNHAGGSVLVMLTADLVRQFLL